jgi:hypothetical protein
VSTARIRRARRLLAFETTRVAERERELATARRALAEVEGVLAAAVTEAEAAGARWQEDETSSEQLAWASARRVCLDIRVARARTSVSEALAEVTRRGQAAVLARMAERRFEILIEGFEATDDAKARKAERKAADEHASRKGGVP